MIKVYVSKQSDYPVDAKNIKKRLNIFLSNRGIVSDASLDIAIVGKKKMLEIARLYLNEAGVVHNVLSFPDTEVRGTFVYPSDGILRLGEIIICYPELEKEAGEMGVLIEDRLYDLAEHGAKHLMGEHHD